MAKPKKKKPAGAGKDQQEGSLALRKLVAKITRKNRHPEIPTGPDIGKEIVEW